MLSLCKMCFSSLPDSEPYETDVKLDFGTNMKAQIYKCQPQTEGFNRCRWYPIGSLGICSTALIYKSVISYTHFIWPCLPIIPMFFFFKGYQITTEACMITTKQINLQRNGKSVEIIDVLDRKKTHPIRTLRAPTDEEMKQLKTRYGSFVGDDDDMYPVLVVSTKDPKLVIQAFYLDKNAKIEDKPLLNAVCRGEEIQFQN